jgi:cytochrome c
LILIQGANAAGADRANHRGRALLVQHCARCHAVGRTGPSPLPAAPAYRNTGDRLDLEELFERMRGEAVLRAQGNADVSLRR